MRAPIVLTVISMLTSLALAGRVSVNAAEPVFTPAVQRELDSKFRSARESHVIPSVAVGVWRPGKTPYVFVKGSADLATHAPRDADQPFRIASITKAFVAVAILQLVEAGTLRKTDPMSRWYPKFPNAASITLDDLLRMRSGIAAPDDDLVLASVYDRPLGDHPTVAEQIAESAALRSKFIAPNTKGAYTDLNYVILGEIVRRVTGHDIGYYITKNIIRKLRLRHTSYPTENSLPGGLHGYGWNGTTRRFDDKTLFNPGLAGPAGAMISNLHDLHVYARAICRGGLLRPATQRSMLMAQPLSPSNVRYGEGVLNNDGICGHSGTINGFNTDMYYFAKSDTTVIINVNRLDKDNVPQTRPFLETLLKLLTAPAQSR